MTLCHMAEQTDQTLWGVQVNSSCAMELEVGHGFWQWL